MPVFSDFRLKKGSEAMLPYDRLVSRVDTDFHVLRINGAVPFDYGFNLGQRVTKVQLHSLVQGIPHLIPISHVAPSLLKFRCNSGWLRLDLPVGKQSAA